MRRIYKTAYLVVADLGKAGDDYNDVAAVFNPLVHISKTTATYEQIPVERYDLFGLPAFEDRPWEKWRRFLARPWFGRLWILQEYALAAHINMLYQLHGEVLPGLIAHMNNRGLAPQIFAGAGSYEQQHTANLNCAAMLSARQYVTAGRSRGLLHHLASFCEATDERDRVYALLGLATHAERSALHVRYSESAARVYHRTAKVLIEQGSGIEVLYEASCHKHLVGLPSWAPNWAERVSESIGWLKG